MARSTRSDTMTLTPRTLRLDAPARGKKCGGSYIPRQNQCHNGAGAPRESPSALKAGAIGLGVGTVAVGLGLLAMNVAGRRRPKGMGGGATSSALTAPRAPRPSGSPVTPVRVRVEQPRLPGSSPRALLAPAAPRKSKTQRMRENTAAAMRQAEGRISQTAREEVRRLAQIGNTMAATGEATGMAVKTGLRELRLRTEAARRRYEPGYRAPDQRRLPGGVQPQLQASNLTPERVAIPVDPLTGQPRRRQAQGFGRRDGGRTFYSTTYVDPSRQRA